MIHFKEILETIKKVVFVHIFLCVCVKANSRHIIEKVYMLHSSCFCFNVFSEDIGR
jgi:hypothetical protein